MGTVVCGETNDNKLDLQSDGGPWRFYPAKNADENIPKVLLIGDSIMNGYRGRVADMLKGKATVEVWLTALHLKSKHLHADLKKVLNRGPYVAIHFNIGLHGWPKGRILKDEYEPLLKSYVDIIRENADGAQLIWASTTQITEKGEPTKLDPINNPTITDRNIVAAKIMKEYDIPVNDLYGLMSDKLKLANGDKFHWKGEGYQVMAKQIVSYLKKALPSSWTIVLPDQASDPIRLAGKEIRRYIYLRTDELLPIQNETPKTGNAIRFALDKTLGKQEYRLKTSTENGKRTLNISGGSDIAILYGAYQFVERLGVRFYIHGDTIPDEKIALHIPEFDEIHKPLFEKRGLLPFHDFPEGPDWWSIDEWKTVIAQMTKMRMNFVGLHCYPKGALGPEPIVWIGLPEDCNEDGTVKLADSTSWHNTQRYADYGCYRPMPTSGFSYGGSLVFDADNYGPEINLAHDFPFPKTPDQSQDMFRRCGLMLKDIFTYANEMGITTCVGTEAPLNVPEVVKKRLEELGKDPKNPKVIQELYEGMFLRIKRSFPLDYYWIWGHEGEIRENAFRDDFLAALKASRKVEAPFGLGICGWGWIANNFPRLDEAFPKEVAFSCINMSTGQSFVSKNFKQLSDREKWAIPWFEDDPGMISPQLFVGRMRKDAVDARDYGCNGLMGLHWRTRILAPNISALAQAGWSHNGWDKPTEEPKQDNTVIVSGGKSAAYLNHPIADTEDDIVYQQVRYDLDGYQFMLPDGDYKVTLKFCEVAYEESGKRVFGVKLQDKTVIDKLDVFEKVGQYKALDYTYDNIKVNNGRLDIGFTRIIEYPCIAAIAIEGKDASIKINCGGDKFKDYQVDAQPEQPIRHLPAGDFYRDWAKAEFGPEVSEEVADIFTKLDGRFPRASNWNRGPGVIVVHREPWNKIEPNYEFVDKMASLRDRVKGAGNLERFDYWLNTFRFGKSTAKLTCARGQLDAVMEQVNSDKNPEIQKKLTAEKALPAKKAVIESAGEMVQDLLAALNNSSELGTLVNIEQQSFLRCRYLDAHDAALSKALGHDLPADVLPPKSYAGEPRLIVPARRSHLHKGEQLTIKVIILDNEFAKSASLYWRQMGEGDYQKIDLTHKARAVYIVTLPPATGDAIEYYIQATTAGGKSLVWPASAPDINYTLVVINK
ncbi:MAG: hypothetical protein JXD22_03230 [Sedimentisphaerales bacterium]|nr:hypothetical protein [Sedimentisphaerales bacterium]